MKHSNYQSPATFAAFVGIDWADRKHDFCLQAGDGKKREVGTIEHSPQAIAQWARSLHKRFRGHIAVCLELVRGPLVSALQNHAFLVLFPVHPATLATYRQAFVPSRAKDDPSDAELALEILLRHPEKLHPLSLQSTNIRTLAALVEARRDLAEQIVCITNQLTSTLKLYYPQVLDWFEDRNTLLFCDFLNRWPTLLHVKRARRSTLEDFFHEHGARRRYVIERRLEGIKTATSLTEDSAIVGPAQLLMQTLVAQLRVLLEAIRRYDNEIEATATRLPDYALFAGLPGAGHIQAPRLMVAFGEDRSRYASAVHMQQYAGIAPVIERSGNKCWVHWRFACPQFLRQTFVEWAGSTIPRSYWEATYYRQQRGKGKSHAIAIRALAFKWIRILYRCWVDRTPYDEARYLKALQLRGSALVKPVPS